MKPVNFIDASAQIGNNVKIWHFAVIQADVILYDSVSVGSCAEVGRGSTVGQNSRISAHVFLPPHSTVGQHVFIGPNVTFTDDRYPFAGNTNYTAQPPIIEDHVSIGAGSVILPGVRIGKHAMIGAGSVVTRSVPPGTTVYGPKALSRPSKSFEHDLCVPQGS